MSSNSGSSAPFGGDHRRSDGIGGQPLVATSSSSSAAASRQSHERQQTAQASQERTELSGAGRSVPHVEMRGPGGAVMSAGHMNSDGDSRAMHGRSSSSNNNTNNGAAAGRVAGAPPRLHVDPSVGLANKASGAVVPPPPPATTTAPTIQPTSSNATSAGAATTGYTTTAVTATNNNYHNNGNSNGNSGNTIAPTGLGRTVADVPGSSSTSTHLHSSLSTGAPGSGTTAPALAAGPSTTAAATTGAASADGETADLFRRPAVALSANLVPLFKVINAEYCTKQRMEAPGTKYNNGFDDREGHYFVMLGEEILGRYTVQEVLGKGSFGTVVRCYDEKRREAVALKITRRGSNFRTQAKLELDLLLKLNSNPALNHLVVKLLKVFDWQGHLVLAFELLSFNLYQLIKCTRYTGVSLDLVRKFAYQLMHTLRHLDEQSPAPIIHCDIKPENILLRNQSRSGIRLIDFGSACYANKRVHRYIQSRFYRSPEVILYLDYTTAIDRWSVGCVLVELFTGTPLFDGRTEAAQLARFEATLGPLPDDMLSQSRKTSKFYNGNATTGYSLIEHPLPRRSLESVLSHKQVTGDQAQVQQTRAEFLDFITQLLRYRPEDRISCSDALQHPFLLPLYATDTVQHPTPES